MTPIIVLKKISDDGNAYGFGKIEIIQFNYNGNGDAIVRHDGGQLESLGKQDLDLVLFGDPGNGDRWYAPVD